MLQSVYLMAGDTVCSLSLPYNAIIALEEETGCGFTVLAKRLSESTLSLAELTVIVRHAIDSPDVKTDIAGIIMQNGIARVLEAASQLFVGIMTGQAIAAES